MKRIIAIALTAALAALACSPAATEPQPNDTPYPTGSISRFPSTPEPAGEATFRANCQVCHGPAASGTPAGPPLVHRIYEPGHHPDQAFHNAVRNGVRQHHWPFGNMAPLPNVTPQEVESVICYVRTLQYQAGIAGPPPC